MATQELAAALQRAESVFRRRPGLGIHDDAPATARWVSGTRVVSSHANGTEVLTDMPAELGGSGDKVTPGWLFRAGLAGCTATRIAMAAAAEGIELKTLEVLVTSKSDTRGLLGMAEVDGGQVSAVPHDVQLVVRIAAEEVPAERLRGLVERNHGFSPMLCAMREAVPVAMQIEVDGG